MRLPVLVFFGVALAAAAVSRAGEIGVVIEKTTPGQAAERAGVRAGDVLIRWSCPGTLKPAGSEFTSPFDLRPAQMEQESAGPVTIASERDGQEFSLVLPTSNWGLETRPRFPEGTLDRYLEAAGLSEGGDREGAARILADLGEASAKTGDAPLAAWCIQRAAQLRGEESLWDEMARLMDRAVELARAADRPDLVWALRQSEGDALFRHSRNDEASRAYQEALQVQEVLAPESLALGLSLTGLGRVALGRGDQAAAGEFFECARAINERLAPGSLVVASSLNNLAIIAQRRGDSERNHLKPRAPVRRNDAGRISRCLDAGMPQSRLSRCCSRHGPAPRFRPARSRIEPSFPPPRQARACGSCSTCSTPATRRR